MSRMNKPVTIKVCGIRSPQSAIACREAGVDLVGLNFVPTSRRSISLETAQALKPYLRGLTLVGVFADQPVEAVEAIARSLSLSWVQLHGSESPAECQLLSENFKVLKAIAVTESFQPHQLDPYAPYVTAFLFDAARAGGGKPFDWERLADVPRVRPLFLAGGLTPEKVAEAIAQVRPDGVDTASGIEVGGEPDRDRIIAFCEAVRSPI